MVLPSLAIRSGELGRAMVDVSVQNAAEPKNIVFENRDILALARSGRTDDPSQVDHHP
jgi:hypothetical protein